jgi:N-acetylmuramoyl-L-alanine amidase
VTPAILVEIGFSTNPLDGKLISTPAGQRKLAIGMADAIVEFLKNRDIVLGKGSEPQ